MYWYSNAVLNLHSKLKQLAMLAIQSSPAIKFKLPITLPLRKP